MTKLSTRSLNSIENKMGDIDEDSIRYRILRSAKNFKTSWIELGQALYSAWKDKLYKEWGYITFDAYTQKEIGIKKTTALKLLKSYYFLEKEEPAYVQKEHTESCDAGNIPNLDSVNMLRLAKNKDVMDRDDYARLKKEVLDNGKEPKDFKKDLTTLIRQREELDPDEARKARRIATLKRLISMLKAVKTEAEASKLLPANIIKETVSLISRIESELE